MLHDAVIVAYGRSPVCRALKGALSQVHPVDYAAETLLGVLAKVPQLDPAEASDLILGCSMPVKTLNLNPARQVVQRAQLPDAISAQTINRYCASSLQAVATCANAIMCGQEEVMIAGGVEDMSHTFHTADPKERNPWLNEHCEGAYISMGMTAENVAAKWHVQRADMEQMAVESHAKAAAAQDAGYLAMSIIPVTGKDAEGNAVTVTVDEGIRRGTTAEKLAALKPCFKEDGVVTAATSSQMSDAAAFAVVMSREKAEALGHQAHRTLCGIRHRRLRRPVHGRRPHLCRAQGHGKGRTDGGRHGCDRAERGFCRPGTGVHRPAEAAPREGQSLGRRHGAGPSHGRHRHLPAVQGAGLSEGHRRQAGPCDHVHRRRHGRGRHFRAV